MRLEGVRRHSRGRVDVGRDLMKIPLPVWSVASWSASARGR
jgi:hypothetical protein